MNTSTEAMQMVRNAFAKAFEKAGVTINPEHFVGITFNKIIDDITAMYDAIVYNDNEGNYCVTYIYLNMVTLEAEFDVRVRFEGTLIGCTKFYKDNK